VREIIEIIRENLCPMIHFFRSLPFNLRYSLTAALPSKFTGYTTENSLEVFHKTAKRPGTNPKNPCL
jgi:hypothetical protein